MIKQVPAQSARPPARLELAQAVDASRLGGAAAVGRWRHAAGAADRSIVRPEPESLKWKSATSTSLFVQPQRGPGGWCGSVCWPMSLMGSAHAPRARARVSGNAFDFFSLHLCASCQNAKPRTCSTWPQHHETLTISSGRGFQWPRLKTRIRFHFIHSGHLGC